MLRFLCRILFIHVVAFGVLSVGYVEVRGPDSISSFPGLSWKQVLDSQVSCRYVEVSGMTGWTCSGVEGRVRGVPIVLTCAHCVTRDDGTYVQGLTIESGVTRQTIVLGVNREEDIAVLLSLTPRATAQADLYRALVEPIPGEDCWTVSDPAGRRGMVDRSIVANPTMDIDGFLQTAIYGNSWYGSSGGPAFVRRCPGRYRLIGLISRGERRDRDQPWTTGLARALAIKALLDKYVPESTSD